MIGTATAIRSRLRRTQPATRLAIGSRVNRSGAASATACRSAASSAAESYRSAGSGARHRRRTAWKAGGIDRPPSRGRGRARSPGLQDIETGPRRPSTVSVGLGDRWGADGLQEDQPQGVEIRAVVDLPGLALDQCLQVLRGHVGERAPDPLGPSRSGPVPRIAGQVEVQEHRQAVLGDEDVGRLDVAVQHAALVRMLQSLGQPRPPPGDGPGVCPPSQGVPARRSWPVVARAGAGRARRRARPRSVRPPRPGRPGPAPESAGRSTACRADGALAPGRCDRSGPGRCGYAATAPGSAARACRAG